MLNLTHNFLLPDYAAYGNTAASSLFPTNAVVADLAHQQQALVGYAHPFDIEVDPAGDPTLTHGEPLDEALELPVDAALGKVDYVEVHGLQRSPHDRVCLVPPAQLRISAASRRGF